MQQRIAMTATGDSASLTWRVTPDILGILDNNGVFIETNPAWEVTLGWTVEEILSKTFYDFLHPDDIPANASAFAEIRTGTPILNFENRYLHKDGSYRWLSWNAVPEGDNYFCGARDVTLAKLNSAQLKSREEEALLREQFVAVLGHDLRNPLATVQSAMNIMARKPQTESNTQMIEIVNRSVARMTGLIDDVTDFARARLGSGIGLADRVPSDPAPVVQQAIGEIGLAHPDCDLRVSLAPDLTVLCDAGRIAQLVSNLLGNAIAHGDPEAPVHITLVGDADDMVLSVSNSGDTIPGSIQEVMFEPFYSAEPTLERKGLGLGLFIVAQIAKAHGGRMSVTSDAAATTFTFRMPLG